VPDPGEFRAADSKLSGDLAGSRREAAETKSWFGTRPPHRRRGQVQAVLRGATTGEPITPTLTHPSRSEVGRLSTCFG